jgi:replication factor A1
MKEEFVKVADLTPRSKRVNLVFKVLSVDEVKNVRSKKDRTPHAVAEALVGDDTGTVLLTLWDEKLETVTVGKTYELVGGYVSMFRGTIRLNIGKYGEVNPVDDMVAEVKTDNEVSNRVFDEHSRRRPYNGFGSGSFWP